MCTLVLCAAVLTGCGGGSGAAGDGLTTSERRALKVAVLDAYEYCIELLERDDTSSATRRRYVLAIDTIADLAHRKPRAAFQAGDTVLDAADGVVDSFEADGCPVHHAMRGFGT